MKKCTVLPYGFIFAMFEVIRDISEIQVTLWYTFLSDIAKCIECSPEKNQFEKNSGG